jgi:hypothetical protein
MSSLKVSYPSPFPPPPAAAVARRAAAASLRSASALLARLAQRLAVPAPAPRPSVAPRLEFYAEAGAPEGALYLDGQLVGFVEGVRRL